VAAQAYLGWNNVSTDINYPSGVQSVYFPSMSLGLAVGLNSCNGVNGAVSQSFSGAGNTLSVCGSPYPTILSTADMGLTWQAGAGPAAHHARCSPAPVKRHASS
jgi:hypothetical protein